MSTFESPYFAAIDLGSNSFHMLVARLNNGQLETVDREKTMVQLARGIDKNGKLTTEAQQRAISCLKRFSERLTKIPASQIRAVATKTLRTVNDAEQFIKQAEKALGQPIQIISGFEEARLVYEGLAHSVINDGNKRLVIDIGGASTELVIGHDHCPELLESLSMGCASFSARFFSDSIGAKSMKKAYLAAQAELQDIVHPFCNKGWDIAYGTSGTIRAIAELVKEECGGSIITPKALDWLSRKIIEDKAILSSSSIPKLRREVLPAGIAVLGAIFDELSLEKIHVADATLKEGLIFDTVGRLSEDVMDTRITTVNNLQNSFAIDQTQADRVTETCLLFWREIECPTLPAVSRTKILRWAAQLHEIGLAISHAGHHHHGYYILRYSDLGGFGRYEQTILANLVRAQRKKLTSERFQELEPATLAAIIPMLLCLRLAVLLNRRRETLKAQPTLVQNSKHYTLYFSDKWLDKHSLTAAGLEDEANYWSQLGLQLKFKDQ